MKTGTLNEICKDLDYNRPFHLTFRRRCWDNFNDNYAKVETVDSIDVFVFYGKESNYKPVQLSYHNTIADDWYVVEEDTDINDVFVFYGKENNYKPCNYHITIP